MSLGKEPAPLPSHITATTKPAASKKARKKKGKAMPPPGLPLAVTLASPDPPTLPSPVAACGHEAVAEPTLIGVAPVEEPIAKALAERPMQLTKAQKKNLAKARARQKTRLAREQQQQQQREQQQKYA